MRCFLLDLPQLLASLLINVKAYSKMASRGVHVPQGRSPSVLEPRKQSVTRTALAPGDSLAAAARVSTDEHSENAHLRM
jgi:hypothetical protein